MVIATVYVPSGKESYFLEKINQYINEDTPKGNPKNMKLVNSIEDVKLAVLESFWTDFYDSIPGNAPEWCEIWLRSNGKEDTLGSFYETCVNLDISFKKEVISFPERLVVLIKANRPKLLELILKSDYLAEIRRARETVSFFVDLPNAEQAEWAQNLLERTTYKKESNTSICILDTGVNNGHLLLAPALNDKDLHAYDPEWGVNDHHPKGHGTGMSGIALFGDLSAALDSTSPVIIDHILESGKILPPRGDNDPELYGYITQQVVSKAEVQAPKRNRVICLATTTGSADRGKPSSWSGAIDGIISGVGEEEEIKRLLIVSAGNTIPNDWKHYPESNATSSIHSPAQSWNALTVGAYTNLTNIESTNYAGFNPLAPLGGLSPYSTTSLVWEKKWPIKPEILFEGGNVAIDNSGFTSEVEDLSVLTTHFQPVNTQFSTFCMTSAAAAKAANMAAKIQSTYPHAWPETVRGLMVHSADWTETMIEQFFRGNTERQQYSNLLRSCGYGIPSLEKALYCGNNSLTLIAQEELQPFEKKKGRSPSNNEMHLYEIPWPKDILLELGAIPVKLRVTLSYFIEPGPGEIGWKDRYRYPSHGLKFDVNVSGETKQMFSKRINKAAREDGEETDSQNDSGRWLIGSQLRNLGSIHSDIVEGTAAEIATCNYIGVFPKIGWWRQRSHLGQYNNKARYSLLVSLETEAQEIDLYTPIINQLKVQIAT